MSYTTTVLIHVVKMLYFSPPPPSLPNNIFFLDFPVVNRFVVWVYLFFHFFYFFIFFIPYNFFFIIFLISTFFVVNVALFCLVLLRHRFGFVVLICSVYCKNRIVIVEEILIFLFFFFFFFIFPHSHAFGEHKSKIK